MSLTSTLIKRTLLAILAIVVLGAGLLIAALAYGISWNSIELPGVRLEGGQIRMAPRLNVNIERLVISVEETGETEQSLPDLGILRDILHAIDLLEGLVSAITIRDISADKFQGRFNYRNNDVGHLYLQGPEIGLRLTLQTELDALLIDIEEFDYADSSIVISGQIEIDTQQTRATARLDTVLAELLTVSSDIVADPGGVSFEAAGQAPVTEIAPIVRLFELDPDIERWISEYTRASEYSLNSISGSFDYDNPMDLIQTLQAEVVVKDTEYTFAQGLEPALAKDTTVTFERGILHIEPHQATFYGQDGANTWVDIDFNGKHVILTVAVNTRAQASGGIPVLLEYYGIPFPFEQLEGMTEADLDLRIDLKTGDISAAGHFTANNSRFRVGEHSFDVAYIDVDLENTVVKINELAIGLDGLFAADVNGIIDPARDAGELDIELKSFTWHEENHELLSRGGQTVMLSYRMNPSGDTVDVGPSKWLTAGLEVSVGPFTSSVDVNGLSGTLDSVDVQIGPWARAKISGEYQTVAPYARLDIQLDQLETAAISMQQSSLDIDVVVDEMTTIKNQRPSRFSLFGLDLQLSPMQFLYTDSRLDLNKTGFVLGGRLSGKAVGRNILSDTSASMALLDLNLAAPAGDDSLVAGNIYTSGAGATSRYQLHGQLHAAKGLLVDHEGQHFSTYNFTGTLVQGDLDLLLNQNLRINWDGQLKLSSHDIGFYLPALLDAFPASTSSRPDTAVPDHNRDSPSLPGLKISLTAQDSAIWLDDKRSIPADIITVAYEAGETSGRMVQGEGVARLNFIDNELHLAGAGFDAHFLDPLLELANIDGGEVRFRLEGNLDDLDFEVSVEDSILRDYKHLNNMLAFANTVPGLVTFNPPAYNRDGLPVSQAYVEGNLQKRLLKLKAIVLESDELSMVGAGEIDLEQETTNMIFNLDSGVKKNLGKIPLVGYVLTGGKRRSSLTLEVKGDLYDPEVSNSAARDVVTYPLQLVARTLLLPVHVVDEVKSRKQVEVEPEASEDSQFRRVSD